MIAARFALRAGSLAVAAAAVLGGCGGEPPLAPQTPVAPAPEPVEAAAPAPPPEPAEEPPPAKPSPLAAMEATVKGLSEAMAARDAAKAGSFFSDDASAVAYGSWEAHGRDAIVGRLQAFFAAFADAKFAVLRVWTKGNVVIQESAWAGTMTGEFMAHPASHKPAGQLRAEVFVFDDAGRVKELHVYADDAGLLAQMSGKKDAPAVPLIPTNEAGVHASSDSPDEDKLAAWAQAYDDALGKGDAAAIVAGLADDADEWVNFSGKVATRGKKAVTKELAAWEKTFPDQKWTVTASWGIDGFAIVEHAMTGTQKGRVGSLRASNKPVTGWHWLTVAQPNADEKAHRVWSFANLGELLARTGALEAPARKPSPAAGKTPKVVPAPTPEH